MPRTVLALFLYVGVAFFFAVNGLGLIAGVSPTTALGRGVGALGIFVFLGVVASVAFKPVDGDQEATPILEDSRDGASGRVSDSLESD